MGSWIFNDYCPQWFRFFLLTSFCFYLFYCHGKGVLQLLNRLVGKLMVNCGKNDRSIPLNQPGIDLYL